MTELLLEQLTSEFVAARSGTRSTSTPFARINLEMDSTSTASRLDNQRSSKNGSETDSHQDGGVSRSNGKAQNLLLDLYGPIVTPLGKVESRLQAELQSRFESIGPLLRHGTQLGGKRMRPAMVLLSAAACGQVNDDHVVLGTVIEMVHTATLIHDDVLDDATTRRHVPTVNARWNEHTSILLGDYLFAQSFRLAATLSSTAACRQIGEASRLVCEGELRQVMERDIIDLDQETYFEIIRSKTAELCRVACALGAEYTGADEQVVGRLATYGDAVGIAFQIADDYLDLWGDDSVVGKTLGTDIEQGKMTLPIIRLLETASSKDRDNIVRILRGPAETRVEAIRPWLTNSDARDFTRQMAERYRQIAVDSLNELADSDAKRSLLRLAEFSVDRRF